MLSKFSRNQKGFTLVELMIVVAIIGILAAIAIPQFANYQRKAKTSEAMANIDAIKTCEVSYKAENDKYQACTSSPAAKGTAGPTKRAWAVVGGVGARFQEIGFEPAGDVYYNYVTGVSVADANGFVAQEMSVEAEGDVDGDAAASYYTMNTDGAVVGVTSTVAPGTAYDISHTGDDF